MSGRGAFAAAEADHRRAAAATAAARRALDEAAAAVAAAELAEATALAALKQLPEYALVASPFGLLDNRGSLRLVTDAVPEDDALCLALTCRALRDALWARFTARPAGDAHAGARVRTRDAAVVRTVGRLAWARGLGRLFGGPAEADSRPQPCEDWAPWKICESAARYGALASLQWARANSCDWSLGTCGKAVRGGQLEVLQWARVNGCD